jgi:hypothetical protein
MAVTVTVSAPGDGRDNDMRALRWVARDLTLSSTYVTNGFSVPASSFGLTRIVNFICNGMAPSADQATANEFSWELSTDGTSINFVLYENAAAGSPSAEKTNGEAVITGQVIHAIAVGY